MNQKILIIMVIIIVAILLTLSGYFSYQKDQEEEIPLPLFEGERQAVPSKTIPPQQEEETIPEGLFD